MSSFQGVGVPLYIEVFSFQGVGIEEFHCIQRCPHFRVLLLYTEVSSFQGVATVYRGILISGCWNRGVPLNFNYLALFI